MFFHNYSSVHNHTGTITILTSASKTTYTVAIGGHAESFDKANSPANSPFVSVQGRGSTLTQNSTTYTYTSPDGAVAVFSKNITKLGFSGPIAAAYITSLRSPDGEIRTFHYVSRTSPQAETRLQSITNNRGYQIKLTYTGAAWAEVTGAIGLNMAVDYCDPLAATCSGLTQAWPTVAYDRTSSYFRVTDSLGNETTYDWLGLAVFPLSIRLPGSQAFDVVYTFDQNTWAVTSVNRNGRIWNYSYSATSEEATTVVTDPANRQSTYVFDATKRSIKSFTNTAGELTTYLNDDKGRPYEVTLPTGEVIRYQYDLRGNLAQVNKTPSPPGSPDLVWQAGYDITCAAPKKCNKPNWTRDPAGNQTDYVYSTAHGNPTSITLPAPVPGGIRPATTYTYTALQAYYKNSSGAIAGAGTNVYYLTRVAQCRTTSGCSASSPDQIRTDIGYGATNVANNRLPVQTTVRNGSGTLIATTNLEYDAFGNTIAVDGPLAGTVDRVAARYDGLRRVIGTVGPDPDDSGPRPNIGVRTTYNARGLPEAVETGNLSGQLDSSWASFVPSEAIVREFDADRRATKTALSAGGSIYAVEQVSFDTLGRIDCRVTRMNPAYFGALPSACSATADGAFGSDRIVKYGYDNADRVTAVIRGFGQPDAITEQAMTYFAGGRVETLTDGQGHKTTYSYDPHGRLYRVYYPDPNNVGASSSTDFEEFGYDATSQVVSTRTRSGHWIATPRDALGPDHTAGSAEQHRGRHLLFLRQPGAAARRALRQRGR